QYEISNFSKVGHESLHNKVYWKNEEYYGFGAGAHGYINGVRYSNINPVNQYINKLTNGEMPVLQNSEVTLKEQMEEQMFLRSEYEISNFSKVGHESLHNKVYWKNEEYYGFGAGAHGYINGVRYSNINPVNQYINKLTNGEMPVLQNSEVTLKEQMEEQMFL